MKGYFIAVFIMLVLLQIALAEEMAINSGEEKEFSGYTVKLKNLKADKAVISVDDESAIFELNEEKIISGLRIKLNEIFFLGNNEGHVKVDVNSLYVCGDGNCDGTESKESCCKDCGCNSGYDCVENECLVHIDDECNVDSDCNDNNDNTLDKCIGGRPKICKNYPDTICVDNSDCDDDDPCTEDKCTNNDCFNERIRNCIFGVEGGSVGIPAFEEQAENELTKDKVEPGSVEKISLFQKIVNFFKKIFRSDS